MADHTSKELDQQHQWYVKRYAAWLFNEDHFEGSRRLEEKVKDYLTQFAAEGDAGYAARFKRAPGHYDNLVARALKVYMAQLFRIDPKRELPDELEDLVTDADSLGASAKSFFERQVETAQLQGQSYVIVDMPPVPMNESGESITEAQAQADGLRPTFERIPVENVINWNVERDNPRRRGQTNWIVIKDEVRRQHSALHAVERYVRYRLWTPEEFAVLEQPLDGQGPAMLIESSRGINTLGVVPLVVFYDRRSGPMMGETVMDDVSLSANALWNSASVRDESFHWQGFNQLVITSDEDDLGELKLGQSRAIKLKEGGSAQYLAPSSIPFEAFEKEQERVVNRVADLVFARTSRQMTTGQVESAEKREMDRAEFIAMLESKASNAEKAEQRCWELAYRLMTGADDATAREAVVIEYNRKYVVDDTAASDWIIQVQQGIRNRVEWYQIFHPEAEDEDAANAIAENLAAERAFSSSTFVPTAPNFEEIEEEMPDEEEEDEDELEDEAEAE